VNVVDSSGWLEYFANGPNAGFFSRTRNPAAAEFWTQDADFARVEGVRYRAASPIQTGAVATIRA
jgi:hypothetical protein